MESCPVDPSVMAFQDILHHCISPAEEIRIHLHMVVGQDYPVLSFKQMEVPALNPATYTVVPCTGQHWNGIGRLTGFQGRCCKTG